MSPLRQNVSIKLNKKLIVASFVLVFAMTVVFGTILRNAGPKEVVQNSKEAVMIPIDMDQRIAQVIREKGN